MLVTADGKDMRASTFRKLALTILYRERKRLIEEKGEKPAVKTLQAGAGNLAYAIELLRHALLGEDVK